MELSYGPLEANRKTN